MLPLHAECRNLLLLRFPPDSFDRLAGHLEPVSFKAGDVLLDYERPITHVYFPNSGIISVTAESPERRVAEVAIIGRDGFVHPAALLGGGTVPHRLQVQMPGHGLRLPLEAFDAFVEADPEARRMLMRFAKVMIVQTTYTALSNAVHQVDERLARWLLMCHDRSDSDDLQLTHEFMAIMISVRRPSITNALHLLEGSGLIRSERGYVMIKNRLGLEAFAHDAYGKPEREYETLLGPFR